MKNLFKPTLLCLAVLSLFSNCKETTMNKIPDNAIVRVSIGYYPPEQEAAVEEKLETVFKEKIMPAVKKLNGNIHYFVAIDKEKKSITNVSLWETREDAMQMAEMKEMLEMAKEFIELGVEFSEITNHEMIWQLPENME